MKITSIVLLTSLVALTGCATSVKPEVQPHEYAPIANGWVAWNHCISSGAVTPDIGALGTRYILSELGGKTYDQQRLDQEVASAAAKNRQVDTAFCNVMAAQVAQQKQQIDMHNAAVARDQQALQNTFINNQPRQVYCNTVGTTTLCNGM